ncbi:helix-turn-helix domain-containing protein, partial [Leuconostocaceae bacterium ESL0958]|nr:helix-turn-helix domain-containing protein [Leuconostocaceae bacterium ESL0958]
MSHLILSSYDRGAIETLIGLGYSLQKIADTLGFSKSTIHYELQRVKPYSAQLAQQDADQKRHLCGRRVTLKPDLKRQIENHLRLTWSPEAVGHYLHVATATLYDWLHKGRLDFALTDLPHRNVYQRRKQETRGTFQIDQSIEQRPT